MTLRRPGNPLELAPVVRRLSTVPRRVAYALLGAALAAGAPAGLLLVRFGSGGEDAFSWMKREIADERLTYVYVALSTMIVFAVFGWMLGRQADRLIELSTTDELTGLLNARGFYQRFHQELARAHRSHQPLSLVILDLDGLKCINDRYGHEMGDRALCAVAHTMRETLRAMDIGARIGGDEFTVIAPNTARGAAITLAERIRTRATKPEAELARLAATISLGVTTFEPSHDTSGDPAALLKSADEALYRAKRAGGNRVNAAAVAKTA